MEALLRICHEQNSSEEYKKEFNSSKLLLNKIHSDKDNVLYRRLTFIDVDQALNTLEINRNSIEKRIYSNMSTKPCCRLVRITNSNRSLLPLARRGRPFFSPRSNRSLCTNCQQIKDQQQIEILKILSQQQQQQQQFNEKNVLQTTIYFDLSTDEQNKLNSHEHHQNEMLVWKVNKANEQKFDLSYDHMSLNENDKNILLNETIKKLEIILNTQLQTETTNDQDNIEFTRRTIQTAIDILSSSNKSM